MVSTTDDKVAAAGGASTGGGGCGPAEGEVKRSRFGGLATTPKKR